MDRAAWGKGSPTTKEGHCESLVSSGALFDLGAFDLQAGCGGRNALFPDWSCPGAGGPYNSAGAWGVTDRLWYLSRPMANQAFTCNIGALTSNGCNAGSNWKTFRAVDDDDGNLANGTPHSCQLAAASTATASPAPRIPPTTSASVAVRNPRRRP